MQEFFQINGIARYCSIVCCPRHPKSSSHSWWVDVKGTPKCRTSGDVWGFKHLLFGCLGLVVIINCPYRKRVRVNRFRCFLDSAHLAVNSGVLHMVPGIFSYREAWRLIDGLLPCFTACKPCLTNLSNEPSQLDIPSIVFFGSGKKSGWWFQIFVYVHPYLGKWSNLTNIFQIGWNHQLENIYPKWPRPSILDDLEP